MNKFIKTIFLVFSSGIFLFNVWAINRAEIEFTPITIAAKNKPLQLELQVTNFGNQYIREVRIYYREVGEARYHFQRLSATGLTYAAKLDLSDLKENLIEYYFELIYSDGAVQTYPESAPEAMVLKTALKQSVTDDESIIIIAPEPNEEIFSEEIVLTVSFPVFGGRVDPERSRIYLDTWDITQYVSFYDDFLTFAPKQVPTGSHTFRVELYDQTGNLLATRTWNFRAIKRRGPRISKPGVAISGQFYAQTRQENLLGDSLKNTYSDAAFSFRGVSKNLSFGSRIYLSNQEKSNRQPVNRYSGFLQLDFWNERHLRVEGGDVYPQLNPFLLNNIFLRGAQAQLYLKFFNLDVALGKSQRAVEGELIPISASDSTGTGTFERKILAIRPSFGARKKFQLGFLYQRGEDDPTSIKYGADPKENVALGSDIFLGLDNQRIIVEGTVTASVYNRNIRGGDIPFQTLLDKDIVTKDDKKIYDLAKKFITVNENLIFKPGLAYQGQVRLRYFKNSISFIYQYVEEDFNSLGQPYLLRDNRGFTLTDNIYLANNQLFLNVGYRHYQNNLLDTKATTTTNKTIFFNLSYFPMRNLPSLSFGYNNYSRNNDLPPDQNQLGIPEDNQTNTINFSSTYSFWTGSMSHRAIINLVNYRRNDKLFDFGKNNANTLSIILQTKYNIPLQTNLELMFQQSESANGTDFETSLDLNSFGLGARYNFTRLFRADDKLMLGINGRFGSVKSVSPEVNGGTKQFNYNRTFLNGRIIYAHPTIGRLSLNADLIRYSGRNYQDVIFTARYSLQF